MKNRTELIEERREQVRRDKFKTAHRILDCMESQTEWHRCLDCSDRFLCRRIRDVIL